jgi:hypothetical protein
MHYAKELQAGRAYGVSVIGKGTAINQAHKLEQQKRVYARKVSLIPVAVHDQHRELASSMMQLQVASHYSSG